MKYGLHIHENLEQTARAAADFLLGCAREALASRGRFTLALAGGSTPRALYALMRDWDVPWDRVELCFGDERCVPPEHPESNARMVREALVTPAGIPEQRVHRMAGELVPQRAARDYEQTLRQLFAADLTMPSFDAVLLGLGADGHTASLFPHSPALAERQAWVAANVALNLPTPRITLTYPVLNAARQVLFLVSGSDKAQALREVLEGEASVEDIPARGVRPGAGQLSFFIDRAAARELRNG